MVPSAWSVDTERAANQKVQLRGGRLLVCRWYLLLEPLHGITYGLVWCAGVHYCSLPEIWPEGLEATAQVMRLMRLAECD